MLAMVIKDHVSDVLGTESEFIGKVTKDFSQLPDGCFSLKFEDDDNEYFFNWDEIHVIAILHYDRPYDPSLKNYKNSSNPMD